MSKLTIDLNLIDISMDKITSDFEKSSLKNEHEYGFKTPSRKLISKRNTPPSIKKEYNEARLKRSRAVIENLNELDDNSDNDNIKVSRIRFSN
jgi:hypothetical protein